jgi:hypothetical protein
MHTCTTKVSVKIFLNQSTGTVRDIDAHNDEEENMVHDEEENIVHDEEENMVHDEVENVVLVNVILGAADGDDALFELRGILSLC